MPSARRSPALLALLIGITLPLLAPVASAGVEPLPFATVFSASASPTSPEGLAWRPDGELLAYFWTEGEQRELWAMDASGSEPRRLVTAAQLPPGCGGGRGPGGCAFRWSPDGEAILFIARGDLYLHRLATGETRRLTETAATEEGATFSPQGDRLAYVREANLYLLDLATGREEALTTDGVPDEILNGTPDWVYWEEIWNRNATGFWWRPDGGAIAFYRFDSRGVGEYPLLAYGEPYPTLRRQRYPHPGGANSAVQIGVVDLASREVRWLRTDERPDSYLVRANWSPDSRTLAVQRLDRGQDRLDLLFCSDADGTCKVRLTEEWPTWVNLGDEFRFLADGGFLWGSDRDGWRRLYRYSASGDAAVRLGPDEWAISQAIGLGPGEEEILCSAFRTAGLGPAERHLLAIPLAGEVPARELTSGRGWHGALLAPRTGTFVELASDADAPRAPRLRRFDGAEAGALPYLPATGIDPASLPTWRYLTIAGPEGSRLPARILLPPDMDPEKRHPVLMYHYGGPGSQVVVDRWGGGSDLWHKALAQRGWIVFSVDNQGSLFFGKHGEDLLHRRFGETELAGQLAGVDYLRSLPYVDPERIGIWGWSGGGTNTLYALFARPGVWRAGVAGAPVTDWTLYDSIWTERYLDTPEENPDGYRQASPRTHAANLADALLVIHGTADDNVHPQNTLRLADDLVKAGRPFEMAIYTGMAHGPYGPVLTPHVYARMREFFERRLGVPSAP